MSGEKVLFDSNVIIYISKRELSRDDIDQFDDIRKVQEHEGFGRYRHARRNHE